MCFGLSRFLHFQLPHQGQYLYLKVVRYYLSSLYFLMINCLLLLLILALYCLLFPLLFQLFLFQLFLKLLVLLLLQVLFLYLYILVHILKGVLLYQYLLLPLVRSESGVTYAFPSPTIKISPCLSICFSSNPRNSSVTVSDAF